MTRCLSDRTITVAGIGGARTTGTAVDDPDLDFLLLAALTLGGLMDPATAVIIAALEADRLHDQRRVR